MENKVCRKCELLQPRENYYKNVRSKDGLTIDCKSCVKSYVKENKTDESIKMSQLKKRAKKRNMDLEDIIKEDNIIEESKRLGMKYCYSCLRILDKSCFGKHKISSDGLNTACKECRVKVTRDYYINNVETIAKQKSIYTKNNLEHIVKRQSKYTKKRMAEDPMFRLTVNLRKRIKNYMKSIGISPKLSKETQEMVGCSPQSLREHIESKFAGGMSWDNYGVNGWHLDHIIPLASAKNKEEIIKLNHYTNLQPLWAIENLKKGSQII